jgi:hypothetical protein
MGILVYLRLVLLAAFRHSPSAAQTISFFIMVAIGTARIVMPKFGMILEPSKLLGVLSDPVFYAILFGSIVVVRLICAPYWVWKEEREARFKAEQRCIRSPILKQLKQFYMDVGPIITKRISGDDFGNYTNEADKWLNDTANWIEKNMGIPAKERFLDRTGEQRVIYRGALNAEHGNIIGALTRLRQNLVALIENESWDNKNNVSH